MPSNGRGPERISTGCTTRSMQKQGRIALARPAPAQRRFLRAAGSQITAIMEGFGQDPDVRVVVIRGKNGIYTRAAM